MAYRAAQKWAGLIFTMYLVLAVMGSCAFVTAANLFFDEWGGAPGTGGLLFVSRNAFDWLAEDTTKIDKASGAASLRGGVLHEIIFPGTGGSVVCRAELPPQALCNYHFSIIKNALPLKLRI